MNFLPARLRTLIPSREKLLASRWTRWLSPWLGHPALWHWSRRGVALGVALGVFFGLLIPLAQIPVTAVAAIMLRANLPAAAASTLVTNPVTFGPVYFAAYRLGNWLTGVDASAIDPPAALATPVTTAATVAANATVAAVAALGDGEAARGVHAAATTADPHARPVAETLFPHKPGVWQRIAALGKPLLVGLSTMATMSALATYFLISVAWRWRVLSQRRARTDRRRNVRG